jgi:hypothetical protein
LPTPSSAAVAEELPDGRVEAPTPPPVRALAPEWDPGVLGALYEVAFGEPEAEIIGVLVGVLSRTGTPARIAAMIPASSAQQPGHAQLDHVAWAYVHSTMARYYAGFEIVGWWVSRPGPDTELEQAELQAAGEWFARPTQFGFVFDSRHRCAALYGLHEGRYVRIYEEPVPRHLTRPVERAAGAARGALATFAFGVAAGVAGWLIAGRPGLSTGPATRSAGGPAGGLATAPRTSYAAAPASASRAHLRVSPATARGLR